MNELDVTILIVLLLVLIPLFLVGGLLLWAFLGFCYAAFGR